MNKNDYIRNRFASEEMADKIREFYHRKGYTKVKVWVEEDRPTTSFGTKLPSVYSVRSNIQFNVASIPKGMIE